MRQRHGTTKRQRAERLMMERALEIDDDQVGRSERVGEGDVSRQDLDRGPPRVDRVLVAPPHHLEERTVAVATWAGGDLGTSGGPELSDQRRHSGLASRILIA